MPVAGASEVLLREAGAGDAATIEALIRNLAAELGTPDRVTSSAEDFRRDASAFRCLIAERDGRAVGLSLWFWSFSSWRGERGVYLQDIWVAAGERGTGLARRLIAETARRGAAEGARYVRLSVDRDNAAARRFYAQLGLAHAGRECIYMATGAAFEALFQAEMPPAN